MDIESLDSCNICMNSYDNGVRPRCLPCGHNFCGSCLTNSIKEDKLLCPFCQRPHRASNASDFPIDYGMESLIIELRKANLLPNKDPHGNSRSGPTGNMVQNAFSDQTGNLKKLIQTSKDLHADALKYKEFIRQRLTEHRELLAKIYDLVYRSEEFIREFDIEDKKLTDILSEGEECQEEAACNLSKNKNVENSDIITASEEVARCYDLLDEWGTRLQQQIPNAKIVKSSEKLLRDTTAALLIANTKEDEGTPTDFSILLLPIMDKLKRIRGESTLTVMDLKTRSESVEKSLELGHVYAVQNREGQTRSAKVTLRDRMIYLHYLQEQEPPAHAHTVQHSDLLATLNVHSVVAFMDLSWGGSVQGRVHILLYPDTPLAHHFRLLCTGDLGPSYALSTLLGVGAKGNENREHVYGGDYEQKNGRGGAPLICGLKPSDRIYERKLTAGCVWALHGANDGSKIAQFAIATGSDKWKIKRRVFGQVQGGLEFIEIAAKLRDIRQVTIEDCGVLLTI